MFDPDGIRSQNGCETAKVSSRRLRNIRTKQEGLRSLLNKNRKEHTMLVAFDTVLRDLDGKPLPEDKDKPEGAQATLKKASIESLLAIYQDEQNLSGEDKLKRWQLATKINGSNGPAEFTVEEVALVKKLIGKAYNPLITGQAWTILEARPPLVAAEKLTEEVKTA
jgi:hypothetical protein